MSQVLSTEQIILQAVSGTPGFRHAQEVIRLGGDRIHLEGIVGSAGAAAIGALAQGQPGRVMVCVTETPGAASRLEADLEQLLGHGAVRLFPQREALPHEQGEPHLEIGGLRVEAVEALFSNHTRLLTTTLRALQERSPLPKSLTDLRIELAVGDERDFGGLVQLLEKRAFERVPLVEEVGQFAVRGGLLDVFSFGTPDPVRIEFWGDEITSLRHFDILDQRSTPPLGCTARQYRDGTVAV